MTRFRIDFDGHYNATAADLFGDKEPYSLVALMDGVSLHTFLDEWMYGDDLRITIRDTVTGERVQWTGMTWMPLRPAEAAS